MTEFLDISSGGSRRIRGLFPVPLVGTAAILSVLILLTPVLFASGQPAPGFLTQAVLVIDRVPGGPNTTFYVHGTGATIRYASIRIGLATDFVWNGSYPSSRLVWSVWQNGTDVLEVSLGDPRGTVAVNVTAIYTEGGQTANYYGLLAVNLTGSGSSEAMMFAISPTTPGVYAPSSIGVSGLPLSLPLQDFGGGGP
jgi:hypothetical protein